MKIEREMQVCVKSPAKVNLTFDVTGDLPNGYHSIVSLFHAISLNDVLNVTIRPALEVEPAIEISAELSGEPGSFPLDESNLIVRAARAFNEKTGLLKNCSLTMHVEKQIPIGAGLAGGSSNAAAALLSLNYLFSSPLSACEIAEMGTTLGADVPFLIAGGTQLGKGKGEILTPLDIKERMAFAVVKPRQLSIATPSVFKAYDLWAAKNDRSWRPIINHQSAIDYLISGDLEGATKSFANVFEPIVFDMHPGLASIKKMLLDLGAWAAQLSGSGPSIFAVVANLEMAHEVKRKLKEAETRGDCPWLKDHGWQVDCFIAESSGCGVQLFSERLK